MIRVTVWRKAAGPISGFQVEGMPAMPPRERTLSVPPYPP